MVVFEEGKTGVLGENPLGTNQTCFATVLIFKALHWIPRVPDERVAPWKLYFAFHLKRSLIFTINHVNSL